MNKAIDRQNLLYYVLVRKSNVDDFVLQTQIKFNPSKDDFYAIDLASAFAKKLAIAYCGIPTVLLPGTLNTELGDLRRVQPSPNRWTTEADHQTIELNEDSLVEQDIEEAKKWFTKTIELLSQDPKYADRVRNNLDKDVRQLTLTFAYSCIQTSYYNSDQKIVWDEWLFLAWELLDVKFDFSEQPENDINSFKIAANLIASILICAGKPDIDCGSGVFSSKIADISENHQKEIESKLKFSALEAGDPLSLLFWSLQRAASGDILNEPIRTHLRNGVQQIYDRFLPESNINALYMFEFNKGMPECLFLSLINANLTVVEEIRIKQYRSLSLLVTNDSQKYEYTITDPRNGWLETLYALLGIIRNSESKRDFIFTQSKVDNPHEGYNSQLGKNFEDNLKKSWLRVKGELNSELKDKLQISRELGDPVAIYLDACWSIDKCKDNPEALISVCKFFNRQLSLMPRFNFYDGSFLKSLFDRINYELDRSMIIQKNNVDREAMMAMFTHKFRGPVDSINALANSNLNNVNSYRLFKDIGRTMNGLLDIFSFVSSQSEKLLPKLREDASGPHTLKHVVHKSLWLAIVQLLAKRNVDSMNMFYFNYAKREKRITDKTTFLSWRKDKAMRDVREAIRSTWEIDIGSYGNSEDLDNLLVWCKSKLMNIHVAGVRESDIHFSDSGSKESLLLVIMTEMLVNAIKHYEPASVTPLVLNWEVDSELVTFACSNPTSKDARTRGEGSGRGLKFLTLIAANVGGKFLPPLEGDDVCVTFSFSKLAFF